jgi:hypothetical protein
MVDSTVYFDLRSGTREQRVSEADLKGVAVMLRDAMRKRGFSVGDLFGSSTDVWGFSIDYEHYDISVGVSPNRLSKPQRWFVDVLLDDPGWFRSTRATRLSNMKLVEHAVHSALTTDLGAQHVAWFLGNGHIDRRQSQPEP